MSEKIIKILDNSNGKPKLILDPNKFSELNESKKIIFQKKFIKGQL